MANYIIFSLIISLLSVITSPSCLIALILLLGLWMYILRTESVTIGTITLPNQTKMVVASTLSVLTILIFGVISVIVTGLSIGTGVSVLHAIGHKRVVSHDDINF